MPCEGVHGIAQDMANHGDREAADIVEAFAAGAAQHGHALDLQARQQILGELCKLKSCSITTMQPSRDDLRQQMAQLQQVQEVAQAKWCSMRGAVITAATLQTVARESAQQREAAAASHARVKQAAIAAWGELKSSVAAAAVVSTAARQAAHNKEEERRRVG